MLDNLPDTWLPLSHVRIANLDAPADAKTLPSVSLTHKAASKSPSGSGTKTKGRDSSQSVSGKANRGDDDDEDPFGLGVIMPNEKGVTEEDSGTGKDELGGRESADRGGSRRSKHEDEAEEEEEDPFGLGAIMASGQHKSSTPASEGSDGPGAESVGKLGGSDEDESGKSPNSGTKRSVPPDSIVKAPSGGTGTNSASKAPRVGGYFSGSSPGMSGGSTRGGGDDASDFQTSGPPFIPSSGFKGARRGYVFQLGRLGLGYYVDKRAREAAAKSARLSSAAPPTAETATRSQDGDVPPGSKKSASGATGKSGRSQVKVAVDVSEALQKLGPLLLKPRKVARAASLMIDLMQAEMRPDNTRMFFRCGWVSAG